jgi:hypothetical protein
MSEHLRHEEMVDALDARLAAPRQAHLAACEPCRQELAGLQSMLREVEQQDVPAPSPLFWDHFADRVRGATAEQPMPGVLAGWRAWLRPVGVMAAAAGALALVLVLRPFPQPPAPGPEDRALPLVGTLADDGSWGLVIGLASELDAKDVREAAKPVEGTADAMIEELTAAQRAALARLLREDIGEQK